MVMPLGDEQPTQIVPVVNYAIIALNVLVFFLQQSQPEAFTIAYSATPYEITRNRDIDRPVVFSREVAEQDSVRADPVAARGAGHPAGFDPFPRMAHAADVDVHARRARPPGGNMLYLWIFGDNVEEVLGHVRIPARVSRVWAVGQPRAHRTGSRLADPYAGCFGGDCRRDGYVRHLVPQKPGAAVFACARSRGCRHSWSSACGS